MRSFITWLVAQVDRGDSVGDLALSVVMDISAPPVVSIGDLRALMRKRGALPRYYRWLNRAIQEFRAVSPPAVILPFIRPGM